MRNKSSRLPHIERMKEEEKQRIRKVKEERKRAKENLKKMGVTHSEWVED